MHTEYVLNVYQVNGAKVSSENKTDPIRFWQHETDQNLINFQIGKEIFALNKSHLSVVFHKLFLSDNGEK